MENEEYWLCFERQNSTGFVGFAPIIAFKSTHKATAWMQEKSDFLRYITLVKVDHEEECDDLDNPS